MILTQDILDKIAELRLNYPNATSIGFGKKQSNGVETGEFAIIVGVKEKKDISVVPAN